MASGPSLHSQRTANCSTSCCNIAARGCHCHTSIILFAEHVQAYGTNSSLLSFWWMRRRYRPCPFQYNPRQVCSGSIGPIGVDRHGNFIHIEGLDHVPDLSSCMQLSCPLGISSANLQSRGTCRHPISVTCLLPAATREHLHRSPAAKASASYYAHQRRWFWRSCPGITTSRDGPVRSWPCLAEPTDRSATFRDSLSGM